MAWCARRLARRCMRFKTGPMAGQMARSYIASADASTRARCLARRYAHGASAEDSIRDGPSILRDGSLAALRRRILFETGPVSCLMARSRRFSGWFEVGPASCRTAHSWFFGGWFGRDGPSVLPGGSHDNCFMGKIRKGIPSHTRSSLVRAGARSYSSWSV